jgi:hypothetical protein
VFICYLEPIDIEAHYLKIDGDAAKTACKVANISKQQVICAELTTAVE